MLQNVIVNFIIHYHKILVVISGYFEKWMETIQQIADFVSPQDLRPIGARPQGSPTLGGPERKRSGGKRVRRGAV